MEPSLEPLSLAVSQGPWAWALLALAAALVISLAVQVRQRRRQATLSARLAQATAELDANRAREVIVGLLPRGELETALEEAVWQAEHQGGAAVAVLCVAVDDLRSIYDGWGQQVGEAMLAETGQRLVRLANAPIARAARLGGDEFAVLLLAADEQAAIAMAARVCAELAQPFELRALTPGTSLAVTVSVGAACYPAHGAWSRLLPHASAAMRHVKQAGGNGHAVFAPAMAVDLRDQALLLQDLRQAVARGELRLLYQPKVDASSMQITAAEALLRWDHPVRGLVPPALFIPLAERHGLMHGIGHWVLREACRQAAAWRESGLRMRIAINISGHQLRRDHFVDELEALTHEYAIPPSRLTCEITESVAMEDTAQTRAAFQRLREAGFHVSIDDFGTGHSSLAVLRRLPAAELKVDRNFVIDLEVSASARSIVEAVLSVARTLSMRVVAEGVETRGQRDILKRMGCDELQGYLFARPMSAVALALWADGGEPGVAGAPDEVLVDFRPSLFDATKPAAMPP